MFFRLLLVVITFQLGLVQAQVSCGEGFEYKTHLSLTGEILSEGCEKDGRPEGFRRNYYLGNRLKSEGYFKNHMVDSLWRFYDSIGKLSSVINFKLGKKNGLSIRYLNETVLHTYYLNDKKHGLCSSFRKNGDILKVVRFENGLENGFGREYDSLGSLVFVSEYVNGVFLGRYVVNRCDSKGNKTGRWLRFYENGHLKLDEYYLNNQKNGYSKAYSTNGLLQSVNFYQQDNLVQTPTQFPQDTAYIQGISVLEYIGFDKPTSSLTTEKVPNNVHADERDTITINVANNSNGKWDNGKPIGKWTYYYPSGKLMQTGEYDRFGMATGEWCFYSEAGVLLRLEHYYRGKNDGSYVEYDENRNVIARGLYSNNLPDSSWVYHYGGYVEKGKYELGMRVGRWTLTNAQGIVLFEGSYEGGLPHGKHSIWFENGQLSETGSYFLGKREGIWCFFQPDGNEMLRVKYKAGVETKWEQSTVEPINFENDDN